MTQYKAIELALEGHNIFLTGKAGTGKTYTLNNIIEALSAQGKNVARTATTGIAATHINGKTIHSFAGLGYGNKELCESVFRSINSPKKKEALKKVQVLVIDEISMLHDYSLDLIDTVLNYVKRGDQAFAGIQIIVCGDFYQLSPVTKDNKPNYVFNAKSWKAANFKVCYLEKIYRQNEDSVLVEILNAMRENAVTEAHENILKGLQRNWEHLDEGINLYCLNVDVRNENNSRLKEINNKLHIYGYESSGNENDIKMILKNWNAEEELHVKTGAKVMFLVNDQRGRFFNGSMGKIVGFATASEFLVGIHNGESMASDSFPIVEMFKDKSCIHAVPFEWKIEEEDNTPIVKDGVKIVEAKEKVVLAKVWQVPIKLAYALTIHKAQGCTFDYVNLDMTKVFQYNMGYVALSRITSIEGLWLKGYNETSLLVDPFIIEKYKQFIEESRRNEGV